MGVNWTQCWNLHHCFPKDILPAWQPLWQRHPTWSGCHKFQRKGEQLSSNRNMYEPSERSPLSTTHSIRPNQSTKICAFLFALSRIQKWVPQRINMKELFYQKCVICVNFCFKEKFPRICGCLRGAIDSSKQNQTRAPHIQTVRK